MNDKPNPTQNFLISLISTLLGDLLRPARYVMRSHMGIRHTALIPIIISGVLYGAGFYLVSFFTGEINAKVVILYAVLIVVGYFRNAFQARHRRRVRDWSVNTWSSGESLLVPVFLFVCRRLYRTGGKEIIVRRLIGVLLNDDFIYYYAEPAVLVLCAAALWSIGSTLFFYPVALAIAYIVVRNDAQLWLYLKAAEIPDGRQLESAVKTEFEGPAQSGDVATAKIPEAPRMRFATDNRSVFDRLNPELQTLLMKDRFTHQVPKS